VHVDHLPAHIERSNVRFSMSLGCIRVQQVLADTPKVSDCPRAPSRAARSTEQSGAARAELRHAGPGSVSVGGGEGRGVST